MNAIDELKERPDFPDGSTNVIVPEEGTAIFYNIQEMIDDLCTEEKP